MTGRGCLSGCLTALGVLVFGMILPLVLTFWLDVLANRKAEAGGPPFPQAEVPEKAAAALAELARLNGFAPELLAPVACPPPESWEPKGVLRCWEWREEPDWQSILFRIRLKPETGQVYSSIRDMTGAEWLALQEASRAYRAAQGGLDPPSATGDAE